MAPVEPARRVAIVSACLVVPSGCSLSPVSPATVPSGVTQQLLMRSLERALFGIPAFQVPILSLPVPEIALFKVDHNRGAAELRLFEFDGKSEDFLYASPIATGARCSTSTRDRFWP